MMPERLSDERLRELTTSRPLTAEARAMAAEIFALRALCAAGPVMPEIPSDAVLDAADIARNKGASLRVYDAIRTALLKEQERAK